METRPPRLVASVRSVGTCRNRSIDCIDDRRAGAMAAGGVSGAYSNGPGVWARHAQSESDRGGWVDGSSSRGWLPGDRGRRSEVRNKGRMPFYLQWLLRAGPCKAWLVQNKKQKTSSPASSSASVVAPRLLAAGAAALLPRAARVLLRCSYPSMHPRRPPIRR